MPSLYQIKRLLKPERDFMPEDDFRIIQSWAEYDETSSKSPEKRNLEYLCYELEVMNPETGERTHFFKAIKFARVHRLPASAKQSTSFMDMQEAVLAGVHEQNYNLITIIANMIKPVAMGLLYLYGVQGVSEDLEEAKEIAHNDFIGFIAMMQGTFRVLEMKVVEAQETEWLREKMFNMDYLTVVRGIPKANRAAEDVGNKGFGGSNVNPDSEGTLEEIITGLADYEYVIEVLSTPVYVDTLMGWQRQSQREMTQWYSQLQGQKSISMNLSIPMMYMANASQSQGWSQAYTDSSTVSYAQGESFTLSQGQSVGESISQSFGQTLGYTEGQTLTNSVSEGFTTSQGISMGETFGISEGSSMNFGVSENMGVSTGETAGVSEGTSFGVSSGHNEGISSGTSLGYSEGTNQGYNVSQSAGYNESTNVSNSQGYSVGSSYNLSQGQSVGESYNVGSNQSFGYNQSQSTTIGNSTTLSQSESSSISQSQSSSFGVNSSESSSFSHSNSSNTSNSSSNNFGGGISITPSGVGGSLNMGHTEGTSTGSGESIGTSNSNTVGQSQTFGSSVGNTVTSGQSLSRGESISYGQSVGQSANYGTSESYGTNVSNSLSQGWGVNESNSLSQSLGYSAGTSQSYSMGASSGTSQSVSTTQNLGQSYGTSYSENAGVNSGSSYSQNVGQSYSAGTSQSAGTNVGSSYSQNVGQNYSASQSKTLGQSLGQSVSNSVSQSATNGYSQNVGQSESVSSGNSYTKSNGTSQGTSMGSTGASTLGTSSSMGLGPSIGYSKSYQWLDQGVKDLLELLEFQNERIKKALRGQGAFYTYVYIGCPSMDALSAAQAVAKSTWQNEFAMIQPLQILNLTETEQKHLLYHFAAFSADVTREDVFGVEEYKYCTVLLPSEYVAYTHLPRISEGGVFSIVQDIPKFSVPSMLKGEIYMGTVLNPERFTFKNGYRTPYDYRIAEETLMHGFFTGASRSGKTVAALRFIAELSKVRRKKTGKRLRIVAMDPKQDWRTLARFVEPERFNFYSMGNVNFRPIMINPWKIPKGVYPQIWIDGVIDIYCRAYGLLERGKQMIAQVVFDLYTEAGVFEAIENKAWCDEVAEEVSELSKNVNFESIYNRMFEAKAELENPNNKGGKAGNDTRDAYARLLDRLSCFSRKYSIERRLYGTSDGIGIDELIGEDDVTVLESKGLENTFKNFIFGVITSGFFKYALAHEGGYLAEDQYETVLVIEEANEILTGNDCAGTGGGQQFGMSGQSEFEQILDQSAGYGLFIFAITQKIADMPSSIIANSGLVFAGKLKRAEDISVVVRTVGREERMDDRDLVKWFPRSPTGWFVCQSSRTFDFKDAEPILVAISRLNVNTPKNSEIDELLMQKQVLKALA